MTFSPDSLVKAISSHRQNILITILSAAAVLALVVIPISIWCDDSVIKYTVLVLFVILLLFYMFWFSFFAIKDRDRLQSESHKEHMAAIGGQNFNGNTSGHLIATNGALKEALDVGIVKKVAPTE